MDAASTTAAAAPGIGHTPAHAGPCGWPPHGLLSMRGMLLILIHRTLISPLLNSHSDEFCWSQCCIGRGVARIISG